MMNAEQTLLAARPESSRLNDDSRRCCSAAPTTSASTIAAPASAVTQIAGQAGDLLPAEPDGDDRAERRAGGDAERVRRRQRVAQHRLKQRARQRQRAAGEQTEQRPRQPQLHEDRPVRFLVRADARETRARTVRRTAARAPPRRTRTAKAPTHRAALTRRALMSTTPRPGPTRVVVSVRRDEKSDSQSGDRTASSIGRVEGDASVRRARSAAWRTSAPD